MGLLTADKFCGCIDLRSGGLFLGYLGMIVSSFAALQVLIAKEYAYIAVYTCNYA